MEEDCPNKKNSKACQYILIILHKLKLESYDSFKGKKKISCQNHDFAVLRTFINTRHLSKNIISKA